MKTPGILVPLCGLAALAVSPEAVAAPPNVVLIISDDQGWRDYSFMGHPHIRTPRIDRLASESLTFRRGYVPSSLCSPSLATILTGRYPHEHKVTSNDPPAPRGKTGRAAQPDPTYRALREEMISNFDQVPGLPRMLGRQGHVSFQAGKWWGGHYRHGGFTDGMSHGDPDQGGRHGDEGLKIGRQTMRPVTDFIDKAVEDQTPFFVWYAPMLPHSPHNPPERLLAKYRDQTPSLAIAKYWACVEWFDESVGQLLDHLDARRIADQTLVVYVTDNGWIQDPDADRYAPRSKQSQYDGGLRTPILIRWPGHVRPRESDGLAQSIDLVPTILAACGVEPPAGLPGINLLDDQAVSARSTLFGAIFTHNAVDIRDPASSLRWRWVIDGDWKLIVPDRKNEPQARVELYDLSRDPDEHTNLAEGRPEVVERLTRRLQAWWPAGG
jgi:uncharacterized sulfatase